MFLLSHSCVNDVKNQLVVVVKVTVTVDAAGYI